MQPPRGFHSEFAPRLRGHLNSLLTAVIPQAQTAPTARKTNRGTNIINYAEDLLADDDFLEDSDGPRRPTGLRSRSQPDPNQSRDALVEKLSKELTEPVKSQGIWREWMGKQRWAKYEIDPGKAPVEVLDFSVPWSSRFAYKSERECHAQSELPLTLIPIRIELDIASFIPQAAFPLPPRYAEHGINPAAPEYRQQEQSPPLRLRDYFMWNLFETLITPDEFAMGLVYDLDLPQPVHYAMQISAQIRQQSEEYAGVAMHPLFHKTTNPTEPNARDDRMDMSRDSSQTPALPFTPVPHPGSQMNGGIGLERAGKNGAVMARATPMPAEAADINNPDDMYRCIITLSINLLNKLYTDKFEWSLLHPPGCAEAFAKQTCADLGLYGEWLPAMTHAIYEAVLRLKKEACESGGLMGAGYGGDIENFALPGQEAGWRYDDEGLGDEWAPSIEILSKEEIQKREDDRERQIRRQRRETARFSSTANMSTNAPTPGPTPGGYFDVPDADTPMGRGERSKKKKRFRSLSPLARSGTPGGQSDAMGFGGIGGGPAEEEKWRWRCSHCEVPGTAVWAIRDGPAGLRTLCNNCGLMYERNKRLPASLEGLHHGKVALTMATHR